MTGKVKRVYYKKHGVMYDIKWDHLDAIASYSEFQIRHYIEWHKWEILDNEKQLLIFKLKNG